MKKCKKCNIEKNITEFHKHRYTKDGHLNTCKDCHNEYSRKYRKKNKEDINAKKKEYRAKNKDKIAESKKRCVYAKKEWYKEQKAKYYKNNKEHIKAKSVKWRAENKSLRKERYANDPLFRLEAKLRSMVNRVYRELNVPKGSRTSKILGCTWDEFKSHLEDNPYGFKVGDAELDLDHIVPISRAENKDDILRLSHYTNFQLLPHDYNRWIKRNNDFCEKSFNKYLEAI